MELGGSKYIIIKYVTFRETRTRMKRKNLEVKESGTMVEKNQFEVEVSGRDTINKE